MKSSNDKAACSDVLFILNYTSCRPACCLEDKLNAGFSASACRDSEQIGITSMGCELMMQEQALAFPVVAACADT